MKTETASFAHLTAMVQKVISKSTSKCDIDFDIEGNTEICGEDVHIEDDIYIHTSNFAHVLKTDENINEGLPSLSLQKPFDC